MDRNRIGLLGICGWGGMALNDAAMDTRVKAVATSVMYDMSRAMGHGVGDGKDRYTTCRSSRRTALSERAALERCGKRHFRPRWAHDIYVDDKGNVSAADRILPETLPANPNPVLKEFFDYYRMPRGFHPRSVNSTGAWNATMPLSFMNMPLLSYASEVTIPTLIVTGEKAHSRYFAEDAFKAIGSKEKALVIVPGANHVDLYRRRRGQNSLCDVRAIFKNQPEIDLLCRRHPQSRHTRLRALCLIGEIMSALGHTRAELERRPGDDALRICAHCFRIYAGQSVDTHRG